MSMMGVKGIAFLEAVWDLALKSNPCGCQDEFSIAQDVLGEVRCNKCQKVILSQVEVDSLERHGHLPKANVSIDYFDSYRRGDEG